MEKIMKVVATVDYLFSVTDDLDEDEISDEVEDRIRSGEYFPTNVIDCRLLEIACQ